jgi:hypothetical protein
MFVFRGFDDPIHVMHYIERTKISATTMLLYDRIDLRYFEPIIPGKNIEFALLFVLVVSPVIIQQKDHCDKQKICYTYK